MENLFCCPFTGSIEQRNYVSRTLFNKIVSKHINTIYVSYNELRRRHNIINIKFDDQNIIDELISILKEKDKKITDFTINNIIYELDNLISEFFKKIDINNYNRIVVCQTYDIARNPSRYETSTEYHDFIELDLTSNRVCFNYEN